MTKSKSGKPRLATLQPRLALVPLSKLKDLSETEKRRNRSRAYNYRWQQSRLRFLAANPLCVECKRLGYITEATVVDHVTPHRGNQVLFWDERNWQALCAPHHTEKTSRGE